VIGMARVTVVIATYNRPRLLRHAIASVREQTVEDGRLLVGGTKLCDRVTPHAVPPLWLNSAEPELLGVRRAF
jgi:GT2 family glycosyltransferase